MACVIRMQEFTEAEAADRHGISAMLGSSMAVVLRAHANHLLEAEALLG